MSYDENPEFNQTAPPEDAPSAAIAPAKTAKPVTLQAMLQASKGQIAMALPKHMTAERMIRVALTAVQKTPILQKCTPRSIVGAIVQASQLGLEPDGVLGQAYMVPYRNKKAGGQFEAQLQIGYRGYIALARRSGEVSTVYSELVYAADKFKVEMGTKHELHHEPNYEERKDDDDGKPIGLIGAYAVVKFRDGSTDFEFMPMNELDFIRTHSKSADDGPWATHPKEMYKKCPIRRLAKRLPLATEITRAAVLDEYIDAGVASSTGLLTEMDEVEDTRDQALASKSAAGLETIKERYSRKPEEGPGGVAAPVPTMGGETSTAPVAAIAPGNSQEATAQPDAPDSAPLSDSVPTSLISSCFKHGDYPGEGDCPKCQAEQDPQQSFDAQAATEKLLAGNREGYRPPPPRRRRE